MKTSQTKDYKRIEQAIRFIHNNLTSHPDLKEIANHLGMSPYHFQRMFRRWAGITPKQFLQFLTKEYAKELLKSSNLLDASLDSGLSGPSRLHDIFVKLEAMTPGEYKQKGKGITIEYGFHRTCFGECFIALTDKGICSLVFTDDSQDKLLLDFRKKWTFAKLQLNQTRTRQMVEHIFSSRLKGKEPIKILCQGTPFQMKVWEALLRIPKSQVTTYQMIAQSIGHPKAVRAVGTAIGKNPVAYLIPCHRVIRGMGHLGGYRWGVARKQAILTKEAAALLEKQPL